MHQPHLSLTKLAGAALLASASLTSSVSVQAMSLADIQTLCKQGEDAQLDATTQGRLQQWFIGEITEYQHEFSNTALGRSGVISFGDFTPMYRKFLRPPAGSGPYYILWTDSGPETDPPDASRPAIRFPCDVANKYGAMHETLDTHWHEFNHAMLFDAPLQASFNKWRNSSKDSRDSAPDHPYIEGLGEYAWEWLWELLSKFDFEDRIREAYAEEEEYRRRGETITYYTERSIWAEAHQAWRLAWMRGKKVARMSQALRDDYEKLTTVRIPLHEGIIRFYMAGGVNAASGEKIKVPEWVMYKDVMRCPVIAGHLNERTITQGNDVVVEFDVRIFELSRGGNSVARRMTLNHGVATLTLEGGDPDTRLEVVGNGSPVNGQNNVFTVDLNGFKDKSRIHLKLSRDRVDSFSGTKTSTVSLRYKDIPRRVNGKELSSFYLESEAVFFIDIAGTGTGSPGSTPSGSPPPSPQPPAQTGSGGPQTPTGPGEWVLVKQEYFGDDRSPHHVGISGNQGTTSWTTYDIGAGKDVNLKALYTWHMPGPTIPVNSLVEMKYTVKDQGSAMTQRGIEGLTSSLGYAYCISIGGAYRNNQSIRINNFIELHVIDPGAPQISEQACILPGDSEKSKALSFVIGDGSHGETHLVMDVSYEIFASSPRYQYTYELHKGPATAKPPKAPVVVIRHEIPDPPPVPPGIDNFPPKDFELKDPEWEKFRLPPKPKPRPKPKPGRWYTHAEKDYRFPLPKQWELVDRDDDLDILVRDDEGIAMFCGRSHSEVNRDAPLPVLRGMARDMIDDDPNGSLRKSTVGGGEAVFATVFDDESQQMFWHVYFHNKGRAYYVGLATAPGSDSTTRLPREVVSMLNELEFLR